MKKLTQKMAIQLMLGLLSAVIVFHILIFIQVIPYSIVWGGRLHSLAEMREFEMISILTNILIITILLLKGQYIRNNISVKLINGFLWLFVALFTLNTLGNLMAETLFEKTVFTALTALSAMLLLIIVRSK